MKQIFFLLMSFFLGGTAANAQSDISEFNNAYMFAEVGAIKGYQIFIQGGIALQLDHHYFKIKSAIGTDHNSKEQQELFKNYNRNCDCAQEQRSFQDIDFMYGRSYRILKHHQVQFGTGVAIVINTEPDDEFNRLKQHYEPEQFNKRYTVGLPAEIRYSFQFKRHFALSATASFNANFIKSYSALSGGFAFGLF